MFLDGGRSVGYYKWGCFLWDEIVASFKPLNVTLKYPFQFWP